MTELTVFDYGMYLGAPCEIKMADTAGSSVRLSKISMVDLNHNVPIMCGGYWYLIRQVKMVLRPIRSLTEPEACELYTVVTGKVWDKFLNVVIDADTGEFDLNEPKECLYSWWYQDHMNLKSTRETLLGNINVITWLIRHHFCLKEEWFEEGLVLKSTTL